MSQNVIIGVLAVAVIVLGALVLSFDKGDSEALELELRALESEINSLEIQLEEEKTKVEDCERRVNNCFEFYDGKG